MRTSNVHLARCSRTSPTASPHNRLIPANPPQPMHPSLPPKPSLLPLRIVPMPLLRLLHRLLLRPLPPQHPHRLRIPQ